MFDTGFFQLARIRRIPVRVHWSIALGMLLFGGLRFAPGVWLGYFVVVLLHELGHAFLVQRLGYRALAVDIHGFGGLCRYDASRSTQLHRSIIAWGGVLAQALLLLGTVVAVAVLGPPRSAFTADLAHVLTTTNAIIIALNLLPFPPLDGADAWRLFGELGRRRGLAAVGKKRRARPVPPEQARGWRVLRPEPSASERRRRERREYVHARRQADDVQVDDGNLSAESKRELAKLFERIAEQAAEARKDKPN